MIAAYVLRSVVLIVSGPVSMRIDRCQSGVLTY